MWAQRRYPTDVHQLHLKRGAEEFFEQSSLTSQNVYELPVSRKQRILATRIPGSMAFF